MQTLTVTSTANITDKELEYVSDYIRKLFNSFGYSNVEVKLENKLSLSETLNKALLRTFKLSLEQCTVKNRKHRHVYALMAVMAYLITINLPENKILKIINRKRCDLWYYKKEFPIKYDYNKEFRELIDRFNTNIVKN